MSEFVWALTPEMINHAKNEFSSLLSSGKPLVHGTQALKVLGASGLPNEELAKIWELSDMDKDNHLNFREYAIAKFLIHARHLKQPIPSSLPSSLIVSLGSGSGTSISQNDPYYLTTHQYQNYKRNFDQHQVKGLVSGTLATPLFSLSGVSMEKLARVWELSDLDHDNCLSEPEFAIAMHLIHAVIAGAELPATVPQPLLQSVLLHHKSGLISGGGSTISSSRQGQGINFEEFSIPTTPEPPSLIDIATVSSSISHSDLVKLYGVAEIVQPVYDIEGALKKLNSVKNLSEANSIKLSSEQQLKHLTSHLESQALVYQHIVTQGTIAHTELQRLLDQQTQLHSTFMCLWNQTKNKEAELSQLVAELKGLSQLIQVTVEGGVADPRPLTRAHQQMVTEITNMQQQGQKLKVEKEELGKQIEAIRATVDPSFETSGTTQFTFQSERFPSNQGLSMVSVSTKTLGKKEEKKLFRPPRGKGK
eukprot:TRINITY_DN6144_c0_g3_i2.p1 TRINITY_DN6144_c0_g3~~TRINITY_DN6144_c0_g3_i2.p1  ORF type:complete len:477 (-),score=122.14 TRINITY_DN6144_c0_g3_i2:281-1711(-)